MIMRAGIFSRGATLKALWTSYLGGQVNLFCEFLSVLKKKKMFCKTK